MKTITWHLEGCAQKTVVGQGVGVQDAFTGLSPYERWWITMNGVRASVEPSRTF
jgi:hypothetical protein